MMMPARAPEQQTRSRLVTGSRGDNGDRHMRGAIAAAALVVVLASADIFDRYEGKGVPEGKVSVAFRLVFQRGDRTLQDTEVGKTIERVVAMLGQRFAAELR